MIPPIKFVDKLGNEITIRPYGDSDIEKLKKMYSEFDDLCIGVPKDYVDIWLKCITDGFSIVAEIDERIVGHAVVVPIEENDAALSIYISEEYQSKGLGKRMVEILIDYCRVMGYRGIRIVTDRNNTKAISFFKKLGFNILRVGFGYEMYLPLATTVKALK
jgi:ribosomal protein S18 acetylase RimI-like enzyme